MLFWVELFLSIERSSSEDSDKSDIEWGPAEKDFKKAHIENSG